MKIDYNQKVILLLLCIFLIFVSISCVNAASTVYVSTQGSDSNDGSINSPYQTIKKGLDNVDENGIIELDNGTYSGADNTGLTIIKSVNINGKSQKRTILDAQGNNRIFTITNGVNLTLNNLELTNGYSSGDGSAIFQTNGKLTLVNSTFTNNRGNLGGAISIEDSISTIDNCSFINNTARYEGAIISTNTDMNITSSKFINNTAYEYNTGAISNSKNMRVIGCTFINNTANMYGGAILNMGNLVAHFNTFINNTAKYGGDVIFNINTADVKYNWWSTNTPNFNQLIRISLGSVDTTYWLYMNITSTPPSITYADTGNVMVSFNYISNGDLVNPIDPINGHIPDGTLVTFSSNQGTLNPNTVSTANGLASTVFTPNTLGLATIDAKTDDQKVTTDIPVTIANTRLTVNNSSCLNGKIVNLTATLTASNKPVSDQKVTFTVNGQNIETTTDSNGVATISYTPNKIGTYTITATFKNGDIYSDSTGSGTLTVKPVSTLYVTISSSVNPPRAGKEFVITYKLGNNGPDAAENVKITFQIPKGLKFNKIKVDSGNYTYNPKTRTVTWTISKVPVGDPYLYLSVESPTSGKYTIKSTLSSSTFNSNNNTNSTMISVQSSANNNSTNSTNTTNTTVNAADTIRMQQTGAPINYLLMAVLLIISGLGISRQKQ